MREGGGSRDTQASDGLLKLSQGIIRRKKIFLKSINTRAGSKPENTERQRQ